MQTLIKHPNYIKNFENLIYPTSKFDFENKYWEKSPLIISRDNPEYYKHLISIENVDEILDCGRPQGSSIRIVKNQEPLSSTKYENSDGNLNLNQLYASYSDGYTIVINEVERFWQPIRKLCQDLKGTFNHKTMANMYLTPKNQKALMPHYDTHDVYVIQIHGKKMWKLYDADYKTPILNSLQPIFKSEQLSGERNITVSAGDLLYIPRGVPHEAVTTDESSLHLTIGVYPTQWMDLLSKSICHSAHSNLELRQALPFGFLNKENQTPKFKLEMKNRLKKLFNEMLDNTDIDGTLQFVAEDFRNEQKPLGDGHFASLDKLDEIDLNTNLEHRQFMTPKVQNLGNIARIIFQGNVIKGPGHIAPCFEFIAQAKNGYRVGDIPLVNNANKIKLSKRLVRGGLLKIKNDN